jgi:prepilin-type N-terminal cleavage/methylation domain-containing protein
MTIRPRAVLARAASLPQLRSSDGRRGRAKPALIAPSPRAVRAGAAGFTFLEIVLVLAIVGLLASLVVPRLGVLRGVALDSSARQLANRIRYLREEAALRGDWIRFSVDPVRGGYGAEVLVATSSGSRFVDGEGPLFRWTELPQSVAIELGGPGVLRTANGLPAAVFAPDGYADPAVVQISDESGSAFSIVVEPAATQPRIVDGRIDPREIATP